MFSHIIYHGFFYSVWTDSLPMVTQRSTTRKNTTRTLQKNKKVYEIQHIVAVSDDHQHVQIQWVGYKIPTWEPMVNIPSLLVEAFLQCHGVTFYTTSHGLFLVDKILAQKVDMFWIQWMDPMLETSWEHRSSLTPDLLWQWENKKPPSSVPSCQLATLEAVYPDTKISERQHGGKMAANKAFATTIMKLSSPWDGVAFLEGPRGNTATALREKRASNMLYPITWSGGIYAAIVGHNVSKSLPFHGSVSAFLEAHGSTLCGVWLDYCSTFHGTTQCHPKEDIVKLLGTKLLAPTSVLACTFSLRDNRQHCVTHVDRTKAIQRWLRRMFHHHGYASTLVYKDCYFPSMFVIMYQLTVL